jgi:PAS domain-containing protein
MNKGDVEKEQDDDLSRETFNNLIMKMMSGVAYIKVVLTAESKPIDYVFLDINSAFEKLTGLRRERVIGHRGLDRNLWKNCNHTRIRQVRELFEKLEEMVGDSRIFPKKKVRRRYLRGYY